MMQQKNKTAHIAARPGRAQGILCLSAGVSTATRKKRRVMNRLRVAESPAEEESAPMHAPPPRPPPRSKAFEDLAELYWAQSEALLSLNTS